MSMLEIIFWFSLALLFYCYVGYGLILFILNRIKTIFLSFKENREFELLPATIVIAAYNESSVILQKIKNCLEIDYPRHLAMRIQC
jgi:poly-beta-1,6-N-acetyl-D-glucosamine synthase